MFSGEDIVRRADEAIEESGLSVVAVAEAMGSSRSQVYRLLEPSAVLEAKLSSLVRLAEAIGVSPSWLLTGDCGTTRGRV